MSTAPDFNAETRIVGIEERLTFQQKLIDDLHGVILEHRRELDSLSQELARCRVSLDELRQSGAGENLPHEKPPHY